MKHNKELKVHDFYNSLNDVNISKEDFSYHFKVWNLLNEKNLGNYSDLDNIQDVLLFADIFENFRDVFEKL